MIPKRKAAAVTAACFIAAALASCGHEPLMEDEIEIPDPVTTAEMPTEEETEPPTEEETTGECQPDKPFNVLGTGGDTFTVVAWNRDEAPILIADWLGADINDVKNGKSLKAPSGAEVNFVCFNTGGYDAFDCYDRMFSSGDDIDVYLCEPDWARKLTDDDSRSAPMSALGITEDVLGDMYPYTIEQGKNSSGVLKALAWDASPGCFTYNAELAKEYLGAETPEEMQALISDWDKFAETAELVAKKSDKKTALADSLGSLWQAYECSLSYPLVVDNQFVPTDEVKDFADMAKKLWECGGVSHDSQWTDDWMMAGQKKNCMGYFIPAWGFENGAFGPEVTGGDTLGQWALCEGPQAYWWGGTMLAVNTATDNGDDAYDFISASVFDESLLERYSSQTAYLPNSQSLVDYLKTSEWESSDEFKANDLIWQHFTNGGDRLSILDKNAKAIGDISLITKYDPAVGNSIYSGIEEKYIRQGMSWDDTVSFIKDDISYFYPVYY